MGGLVADIAVRQRDLAKCPQQFLDLTYVQVFGAFNSFP